MANDPIRDPEEVEIAHLRTIDLLARTRVLEIGSGNGRLTWRYAAETKSVVGVDPEGSALQEALAARPPELATRVQTAQALAEALPFRGGSFEAVILAWSL